ncbi:unnamed protein product [Arctogadus glacialis]
MCASVDVIVRNSRDLSRSDPPRPALTGTLGPRPSRAMWVMRGMSPVSAAVRFRSEGTATAESRQLAPPGPL